MNGKCLRQLLLKSSERAETADADRASADSLISFYTQGQSEPQVGTAPPPTCTGFWGRRPLCTVVLCHGGGIIHAYAGRRGNLCLPVRVDTHGVYAWRISYREGCVLQCHIQLSRSYSAVQEPAAWFAEGTLAPLAVSPPCRIRRTCVTYLVCNLHREGCLYSCTHPSLPVRTCTSHGNPTQSAVRCCRRASSRGAGLCSAASSSRASDRPLQLPPPPPLTRSVRPFPWRRISRRGSAR